MITDPIRLHSVLLSVLISYSQTSTFTIVIAKRVAARSVEGSVGREFFMALPNSAKQVVDDVYLALESGFRVVHFMPTLRSKNNQWKVTTKKTQSTRKYLLPA